MSRSKTACRYSGSTASLTMAGGVVALGLALAGCSADIGRFGGPSLGYGGDERPTSSLPTPAAPMRQGAGIPVDPTDPALRGPAPGPRYGEPRPYGEPPVRLSGLPEPTSRPEPGAPSAGMPPARAMPPPARTATLPPTGRPVGRQVPTATPAAGALYEVQPGDTLYGLSKRHRVSISELMTLNNLQTPNLKPGQKLVLPAGRRPIAQRPVAPPVASLPAARPVAPPLHAPAVPPAPPAPVADRNWGGSYTVVAGDSLYGIARRHKVKVAELQSINGITDPTKVRPGVVLKVPGHGSAPAAAPAEPRHRVATPPSAAGPTAPPAVAGTRPRIINGETPADPAAERRVAALAPGVGTRTDAVPQAPVPPAATPPAAPPVAAPAAAKSTSRFRWPVKGKVIAEFGPRADKTHNDGINISVPKGTPILAAESGVVAYAGNELKGYGNLILIRHENNWVSAYAHGDQILVKRGDKVKRGQAIAKAGTTGAVEQPQVHFELRQGSKPVDPKPHMEQN